MSWAQPSEVEQLMHGMKMKGKLASTQTRPTRCQDFFCPYFLHTISLVTQEVSIYADFTCRE